MSRKIVEWLRDHARRCDQRYQESTWRQGGGMVEERFGLIGLKHEAEYAHQFADEIERRFADAPKA